MTDRPDWQPFFDLDAKLDTLNTSIGTLTTAVNALAGGFGQSTSGWSVARDAPAPNTARTTIIAAPGVGKQIVLASITCIWIGGAELRGWVAPAFAPHLGSQVLMANLSPESPTYEKTFPPQSQVMAANTALDYDTLTFIGAATTDTIVIDVYYYIK